MEVARAAARLRAADGRTAARQVADDLERLSAAGPAAAGSTVATLAALLAPQAALYAGRDQREVGRLRAFVLLTISRLGGARQVWPVILDHLANSHTPYEFAAGARAAAAVGPDAAPAAPLLVGPFEAHYGDDVFQLDRFGEAEDPSGESTTAVLEALRTLSRIGPAARSEARVVRAWLASTVALSPRAGSISRTEIEEARKTLAVLGVPDSP